MKKVLIVMMVLILGVFNTLLAQGVTGKGAKVGLNMAKFTGSDADFDGESDPKFAMGFAVGGYITYGINDQMSIRPEFLYSVKGSKYEESEGGETMTINFAMNYLDIPVLGVYSVQENISVFAGPYFGLFLGGKMKMEYAGESEEEDIEKEDTANDFGLVFGGSYGINDNISIEARYTLGMKTIDKEPEDWESSWGAYEESDIKNSALQIMVNYAF
jgi:opacity protein-like surface antigen